MAYVSTTSASFAGSSCSFGVSVSSGDVLVAFLYAEAFQSASGSATIQRLTVPAGWTRLGLWAAQSAGDPRVAVTAVAVAWTRVSAGGTHSATLTWGGQVLNGGARILRYSGMKAMRGSAGSSFAAYVFPAVPDSAPAAAGHAIRLAIRPANMNAVAHASLVPASHTLRTGVDIVTGQFQAAMVVSDQSLTSAAPAAASASGPYAGGARVTIYLGSTIGPPAPTITSPTDPVMDLSAGFPIAWTSPVAQTGARVTYQTLNSSGVPTGSVNYLTATTPTWSTTPTTVTTTAQEITVPAALLAAGGQRYRITVATVGDASRPDLSEAASVDIESWQLPTADDVYSGDEVGGVVNTRAPWVVVAGTPGSGAALDLCEVEVVDHDTGAVLASGTHAPGWWFPVPATAEGALPNDTAVRFRGRVRQRGSQWSAWIEAGPYTVTVARPATPAASVEQIAHPVSGAPGLGVTVTSIAGTVALYRDGTLIGEFESEGSLQIQDYLAPSDVEATYEAVVTDGSAPPESSLPATAAGTLTFGRGQWLIDAYNPEQSVGVILGDVGEVAHGTRATAYQPIGTPEWIVHSLGRVDPRGSLTLRTLTQATTQAALDMLTPGRLLMLRRPRESDGYGDRVPPGDLWFRVAGDVAESYIVAGPHQHRELTFEVAHQDPL